MTDNIGSFQNWGEISTEVHQPLGVSACPLLEQLVFFSEERGEHGVSCHGVCQGERGCPAERGDWGTATCSIIPCSCTSGLRVNSGAGKPRAAQIPSKLM